LFSIPTDWWGQASPALRDRFLHALDRGDAATIENCARDLQACNTRLPGQTCIALGLAHGSTYADAARVVAKAPTLTDQAAIIGRMDYATLSNP
jgi:hypothetical protein